MMDIRTIIMLTTGGALLACLLALNLISTKNKRLERDLENQSVLTEQYRQQTELWRTALEEHNKRIRADAEKITAFEEKVKDLDTYIETLEDRDSVCLSDTDTGRLRQLWGAETVRP